MNWLCSRFRSDVLPLAPWLVVLAGRSTLQFLSCKCGPKEEEVVGEVSELYIHPVRALRPVRMSGPWELTAQGFLHDKGMCLLFEGRNERLKHTTPGYEMLYDIEVSLLTDTPNTTLVLSHKDTTNLEIDLVKLQDMAGRDVEVCPKGFEYCHVGEAASAWISGILGVPVRLMFSPTIAPSGQPSPIQSLDPVLIIGEASLAAFSQDAGWKVEMERFRPNMVSVGHAAYADETWQEVRVGSAVLEFCHRCTRCSITNVIDGVRKPDTMECLKRIRPRCDKTNKPVFGSYFKVKQAGSVQPGDKIVLIRPRVL